MLTKGGTHLSRFGLLLSLFRLPLLLLPGLLLALAADRAEGLPKIGLALGAVVQALAVVGLMIYHRSLAPSLGITAIACYLTGLAWLWLCTFYSGPDWFTPFAQAILVAVPVGIVAAFTLLQSSSFVAQRSHKLAAELAQRSNWPPDLPAAKDLPEVKAFRESLQYDATPAIQLLSHVRPEVRIAAATALEFRQHWRPGHAEAVMGVLEREQIPQVRAALVSALANINDRLMVDELTNSLRDPDLQVRRSAAIAAFWNSERRWSWIRMGVRRALTDPLLQEDGPLLPEGHRLAPEAVNDLTAWAAQKGVLGFRAVQMLVVHYARVLHEVPEDAVPNLCRIVGDSHSPPLLRIELARLLHNSQAMESTMLEGLLNSGNPAPLRLIAAEALLDAGPHMKAIGSLRDIAHLPNRELALATAAIVQRRLGVDLGLGLNQPLPALNSSKAIDIIRRLMAWAARPDKAEDALDSQAVPMERLATNP